jgi:hypothetical protein
MRVLALPLTFLALLLLLAACGERAESPAPAPTAGAAPTEPPVPTSLPDVSAPPSEGRGGFRPMGAGLGTAAAKALAGSLGRGEGAATTGSAQLTLMNQTSVMLDLYVDDGYGCRALKNLMCTTQVTPGFHSLSVKGPNGESLAATYTFDEGESVTWTVTEE